MIPENQSAPSLLRAIARNIATKSHSIITILSKSRFAIPDELFLISKCSGTLIILDFPSLLCFQILFLFLSQTQLSLYFLYFHYVFETTFYQNLYSNTTLE
jgi:hypothetical protein